MKRQFVKITPAPMIQDEQEQQGPQTGQWSPADRQAGSPFAQQQAGSAPPPVAPQQAGAGPQPNWNAYGVQPASPQGPPAQAPQPLQGPEAARWPLSGPQFNNNGPSTSGFSFNQVSPYQSGANLPLAGFPPGQPQGQMFAPPTMQPPPGWQGGPFMSAAAPQTMRPPFAPGTGPLSMPGGPQSGWDGPPPGYPGGAPPFIPPPGFGDQNGRGPDRPRKKRRVPIWARVVLAVLLVLLVGGGSAAGYYYYAFSGTVNNIVGQQAPRLKGDVDPNQGRGSNADILSGPRINILLLGSDTDQKFTGPNGQLLAQTDIVVTIDPASKQVGMLSIPRDFWLNIPGQGVGKLDEAFISHGAASSRLTIFQDFGIPINYYAWVGLNGFIKVINTVNGVDVDVLHPITDDTYPDDIHHPGDKNAYKRLYLAPGPQHLTGEAALEYVRSRHADLVGDFGRSVRQQQILTQLKTKLNNPNIVNKLPDIANDLNGSVKTDMGLADILKMMNFARSLDMSKIKRVTLGPPYSHSGVVSRYGSTADVVIPNCALILPVIRQMFGLGDKARCNIGAIASNNGPVVAAIGQGSQNNYIAASNSLDMAGQVTDVSLMNLQGNGNSDNLLGLHSLIDLLCMIVFESPSGAQV
ncbi:MAG: LCP family protein [Ktedonobacteraceae bacterium]